MVQDTFAPIWEQVISKLNRLEVTIKIAPLVNSFEHLKMHHFHVHPELFIQLEGISHFSFGKTVINLSPGEILIIPPGIPHNEVAELKDEKFKNVVVATTKDHIDIHYGSYQKLGFPPKDVNHSRMGSNYSATISQMINQIFAIEKLHGVKNVRQSLLASVFQCVLESPLLLNEKNRIMIEHPIVCECLAFIRKHYNTSDCNIQHIAKKLNCSPNYLSSIFQQITGSRLQQTIKNMRMEQAENLLRTTAMNVNEVSETCGYDNVSYFVQQFKQFHGLTPKRYLLNKENN